MVRALLDGRKSVTRRIVNPQPRDPYNGCELPSGSRVETLLPRCPYGAPGDLLWVRETWADISGATGQCTVAYRASCENNELDVVVGAAEICRLRVAKWRPSIHMPKWAARLWLRVEDVRVERLQDISEEDAKAEGVPGNLRVSDPRVTFASLWDSINADRAPWASNPWVWVVSFSRAEAPKREGV
jgi:hypothetical protein